MVNPCTTVCIHLLTQIKKVTNLPQHILYLFLSHSKKSSKMDQPAKDNRSDQLNPNNPKHEGGTTAYTGAKDKPTMDNKATVGNPNNPKHEKGKN